jgi:nicotinate dehydrogenase subunit A
MTKISMTLNGRATEVDVAAETPLLYVLRNDLSLIGPKFGCGLGQCGACTVIIDGAATRSCLLPVVSTEGCDIVTLDDIDNNPTLNLVRQAFIDEQAAQCGYCIAGMIMTVTAILIQVANPTEAEIRQALAHNLCRCGTHLRIMRAVRRALANRPAR